jgi:nucleoside-diphosphate-sugar epimerase
MMYGYLVDRFKAKIGGDGELNSIQIPQFHKTVQVRSMWMLSDKLKSLGYEPKYDLEAIIEDMVK